MYYKIILKVTKSQGLTLSLKDTFFEKPQGGGGGGGLVVKLTPLSRFRVNKLLYILLVNRELIHQS